MMKSMIVVALLLGMAACGSSKSDAPGKDWSGKPLDVTVKDQVKDVEFSIQAPAGMKLDGDRAGSDVTRMWKADLDDYFSEPGFTVSYESIPPRDLDGFVAEAMLDAKEVIVKKEALADGFVLIHHNASKGLVYARVLKVKGEHHLGCTASQAREGGVPSPDKTLAWLEQLCMSLTIL